MDSWIKHDVKEAKEFNELWPELKPYFTNTFIVAHNASFDISVLRATLDAYHIPLSLFLIMPVPCF